MCIRDSCGVKPVAFLAEGPACVVCREALSVLGKLIVVGRTLSGRRRHSVVRRLRQATEFLCLDAGGGDRLPGGM
eukprot:3464290-Alexandrium_andersonii.AAC.1